MNWATVGCLAQLGDKAQSLSKDRGGGERIKTVRTPWVITRLYFSYAEACTVFLSIHALLPVWPISTIITCRGILSPMLPKSSCIFVALRGQCPNSIRILLTTDPSIFTLSQRFYITEGSKLVHDTTLMYKTPKNKSKGRWITRHHI